MAEFKPAVALTLVHEGGYVNDTRDAGGETYRGISRVNHPDWPGWAIIDGYKNHADFPKILDSDEKLQNLVIEEYREGYWKNPYSQIGGQDVANKLFDMGVLFGVGEAAYLLQRALNFPAPKWTKTFDEMTLLAVNSVVPSDLLTAYKTHLVKHALNLVAVNQNDKAFFAGWVTRINS